jgi:hypothetical protein
MKPQAVHLDLAPRVDCGGEGISGFFQRRIRRLFDSASPFSLNALVVSANAA